MISAAKHWNPRQALLKSIILNEVGVLAVEGSRWLLGFWGKKNVAGIIQMPITRHQVVHIKVCYIL